MYNDDDGCAGCLTLFIILAIVGWFTENWVTILIVIGSIIAIGAAIAGFKSYEAKKAAEEEKAKAEAYERAKREDEARAQREREAFDRYFSVQKEAHLGGRLDEANAIIRKLFKEWDDDKRPKILAFFDKYLPLMTEIIEAGNHGGTVPDEACKRFTETVKAFSRNVYSVDDVIDVNQATMESLSIVDGLYDPYADIFSLGADNEAGDDTAEQSVIEPDYHEPEAAEPAQETVDKVDTEEETQPPKVAPHKKPITAFDVEMAMQDRLEEALMFDDFDTIRDMLDSGVISELDIDDDVLEKVEDYV